MDQESYESAVETLFSNLDESLSFSRPEIEWDIQERGLSVLFQDDSQLVITRQAALKEVWIASKLGAQHFRWTGQRWQTSQGEDLYHALKKIFTYYQVEVSL